MANITGFVSQEQIAVAGIIAGIMLSLAPIPTFIDIVIHSKSTGGYTVAPYVSSFLCCSAWLTYALVAGSAKAALIPLNAVSFAIYSIYCGLFLYYSENKSKVLRIYMASLGLIALLVCVAVFVKSLLLIGIIATIANCLMFAAPLAVMQQVIRTKSVRYMPFLLSLASFLCALVWLVWAILSVDYFVLIPNALGSLFGLVQLVIYGVYWRIQRLRDNEETQRLRDPESDVSSEDCPPLSAK